MSNDFFFLEYLEPITIITYKYYHTNLQAQKNNRRQFMIQKNFSDLLETILFFSYISIHLHLYVLSRLLYSFMTRVYLQPTHHKLYLLHTSLRADPRQAP